MRTPTDLHKLLTVVIVHWNTPDALQKCLDGLLQNSQLPIIIVDNNSTSRPDTKTLGKIHQITYIQNETNRGYASACNHGVLHASTPWVLFLNPDTHIGLDSLEALLTEADGRGLDACSPSADEDSYMKPLTTSLSLLAEFTPLKHIIPLSLFKLKTLFGGGLLIKTQVLKDLGGWDERFFLWFEDSDLTRRLHDRGHSYGWVSVPLTHAGGSSFKKLSDSDRRKMFFHAMRIYARKHFGPYMRWLVLHMTHRYSSEHVLMTQEKGISMTIPNMDLPLLDTFLRENEGVLKSIDELIIVSSGLDSQSVWQYRKKHPSIIWIPIMENHGFAHTVNIGLRRSTYTRIGTCNDDTILSKSFFSEVTMSALTKIGSLNPVVRKPDGRIESVGITVLKKGKALPITTIADDVVTSQVVDATNGACVVYEKTALNTVGIFDEKFGSYLEDIDLSLRLSRAGFHNYVLAKESITHLGQQTSRKMGARKRLLDLRNWMYVIAKNWSHKDLLSNFLEIAVERGRNLWGVFKG